MLASAVEPDPQTPALRIAVRALVLVAALLTTTALAAGFVVPAAMDTTQVHMPGDVFAPAVIVVHVGDTVTWVNDDSDPHSVVAYPGQDVSFDIDIAGGDSGTYTFTQAGIVRYYCDLHAAYDGMMGDVKALPGMDVFPTPMRGVVVVLDANDSLPASDTTTVDIPESTMLFTPWALTVPAGTTVDFVNDDEDPHMVTSVAGESAADITPIQLDADGGAGSFTFTQPGVYYYLCPIHATWDASRGMIVPLESFGMYPFVMDGLIVVTAN